MSQQDPDIAAERQRILEMGRAALARADEILRPGEAAARAQKRERLASQKAREDPWDDPADLPFQIATDIHSSQQRWLIYPYLAGNAFGIMAGDPGCGKSSVALALIAELSNGRVPPGMRIEGVPGPQKCLFVSVEDTGATIARRLIALGANRDNVKVIAVDTEDAYGREPTIILNKEFIKKLEKQINNFSASILVLDTVAGMIHSSKDMNRQNVVRAEMKPLQRLAARTECCVLGLAHFTKGGHGRNASSRVMGSLDFTAVARIVILMGSRAEDREHPALVVDKSNLGPRGPQTSYGYQIRQQTEPTDPFVFNWTGPSTVTAEEMTSTAPPPSAFSVSARCAKWLRETLQDGPKLRTEVFEEGEKHGYASAGITREWTELTELEEPEFAAFAESGYNRRTKTKGAPPKWWGRVDADWQGHWEALQKKREAEEAKIAWIRQRVQSGLERGEPITIQTAEGVVYGPTTSSG